MGALLISPVVGLATLEAAASFAPGGVLLTPSPTPAALPDLPSGAPGTGGPGIGFVIWTLCLQNNDLLGGLQVCGATSIEPTALLWDSAAGSLLTETGLGNVTVLSGQPLRVNRTIPVGTELSGLSLDPSNGNLVVGLPLQGDIAAINVTTGTLQQEVGVGGTPQDIAFDPADGYAFVTDALGSSITVLDSSDLNYVTEVAVGGQPGAAVWDAQNGHLYVVNGPEDAVDVLTAPGVLVGTIPVGSFPDGLSLDPGTGLLFVSNRISENVTVVSTATDRVVGNVGAGRGPAGILADPAKHFVYVADEYGNNVTVINESNLQVVGVAEAGGFPNSLALDPATGDLFVTNALEGSLSTMLPGLQGLYTVQFTPQGVAPDQLSWSLSMNGSSQTGRGDLGFLVSNGSYQFTIDSSTSSSCHAQGSFVVDGQPLDVFVPFQSAPCSAAAAAFPYLVVGGLAAVLVAAVVLLVRRQRRREEEEDEVPPWPANEP